MVTILVITLVNALCHLFLVWALLMEVRIVGADVVRSCRHLSVARRPILKSLAEISSIDILEMSKWVQFEKTK